MPNVKVNCLVRVRTNNSLDFTEWLKYHIAIGFDCIYVFDTGNRRWIDDICAKYSDHTVVVPRTDDWRLKKNIISTYNTRHLNTWAICLDDDEYLWIDFRNLNNIKQLIDAQSNNVRAISVFTKYLSSEKPMKNRVGTMIDCFVHSRQNPQGFMSPNANTPNCSVTFFYTENPNVSPMANPVVPATKAWVNVLGEVMNSNKLMGYLNGRSYDPTAFPVRCYKYGLKSGIEMELKPGTCPSGYTVLDDSMQKARETLLHIPVNLNTETLFAKSDVFVENVDESIIRPLSNEENAENMLPITAGKIDEFICSGKFLEDVIDYLDQHKMSYDRKALETVFEHERVMIIESSEVYRKLNDMIAINATEQQIMQELKLTKTSFNRAMKALTVLDINSYDEEKNAKNAINTDDVVEAKTLVDNDDIIALTSSFNESVMSTKTTMAEMAELDAINDEKKAKRKAARKSSAAKKKTASTVVEKLVDDMPSQPIESMNDVSKENTDSTNLLDNTDLSSFGL